MKAVILAALFVVAVVAVPTRDEFNAWALKHKKVYGTEEADRRFHIYTSNWYHVQHLNKQGRGHFSLDNQFADLSRSEFRNTYLTLQTPARAATTAKVQVRDAPDAWDWREHGAVAEIKDQGQCGSCWAFSAVGNMEGQNFLHGTKELVTLAESQLVDCDKADSGCNGGLMGTAFEYAIKNGMETEKDYPYKASTRTCAYSAKKAIYKFSNWTMIEDDEEVMKQALYEYGPLAIAVDAENWSYYSGGIYDSKCTSNLDHGVTLVGYGTEKGKDFWLIRNSWGKSWGENGYIRLIRGKNKCGINQYVCTILV
jgi:C1A family cysteine protease